MLPEPLFLGIHMYGVMTAIGVACAFFVLELYGKKLSLSRKLIDFTFYTAIVSIAVGFLSATVFQSVYNYLKNPQAGFSFGSGMTFLGGLIGGSLCFIAAFAAFGKRSGGKIWDVLPILPSCITIAHAFGRIGCFFAGCCYGRETDFFLAVKFPNLPSPVHPTQLYEAAFLFLLFTVLSLLLIKKNFRHTMGIYLIAYGIFRFMLEFLRADERGSFIGSLSPSQFWSAVMVILGILLIVFVTKKKDRRETGDESNA